MIVTITDENGEKQNLYTQEEVDKLISEKLREEGPLTVHYGLLNRLMRIAKANPNKNLRTFKEGQEILVALDVFEDLYPKFKSK